MFSGRPLSILRDSAVLLALLPGCLDAPPAAPEPELWTCSDAVVAASCPADAPVLSDRLQLEVSLSWSVTCNAAVSAPLLVTLPEDLEAVHVTVAQTGQETGMELGLDGTPLVTAHTWDQPPYRVLPGPGASALLPNRAEPAPWGCLAILPMVFDRTETSATVWLHGRRAGDVADTLRVQPIRADDVQISDDALLDLIAGAAVLLEDEAGVLLEAEPPIDMAWEEGSMLMDTAALLESTVLPDGLLPVFFVERFASGLRGQAGGIPGAIASGTGSSGMILAVQPAREGSSLDLDALSVTLAHEVGHQLGLFHLTEIAGQPHDVLADTPECTATADAAGHGLSRTESCPEEATSNLMFHTIPDNLDDLTLSAEQGLVLRRSPALVF